MKKRTIAAIIVLLALIGGILLLARASRQREPLVSAVMLTYRRANLLPKAIEGVLAQDFDDFEFIIINDGSADGTDDIIKKYSAGDSRIRYYKNRQNRGISYSRNRAASYARGKYIMIMDDDDEILPQRMSKQVEFLEKNPDIAAVAGQLKGFRRIPLHHDEIAAGLIQYNNFGNANVMYRRDFAQKNHIRYDENLLVSEDWDFWLQMLFAGGRLAAMPDDVLLRNVESRRYHKIGYEEANVIVRRKVGEYFSPQNAEAFYAADGCGKLKMIAGKNIFSPAFVQQALEVNCRGPLPEAR